MAGHNTQFETFLENEVKKYGGVAVPVRAGLLRRALIRNATLRKLHPNPDDEFCAQKIGPNYEIISNYKSDFTRARRHSHLYCEDPLVVEKTRPDGYRILNGHHRWAAALMLGYRRIPIRIVDLTQETDIRQMLLNSKHDRRVTLDLDEAVFCFGGEPAEKMPPFPLNRIYREPLRLGIPALFHFLTRRGYDIWVYSANYYSLDYIRRLFRSYKVNVDGVVTGTARKEKGIKEEKQRVDKMILGKYACTLHIDGKAVLRTTPDGDFTEYPLSGSAADWSREVMEIVSGMEKEERA